MGILNPQIGEICRALYVGRGSVETPSLSFEARPGTGFFLQGDSEIGVSINGVEVFAFGDAVGVLDFGGATITFPTSTATLATLGLTETLVGKTLTTPVIGAATGTSLSLTGALAGGTSITPGAGTSAALVRDSGVWTSGSVIVTRMVVDLTGVVGSTTDLDIIGNTGGTASAHWGQITTAVNGVVVGGRVTCLEAPAGGADDIDFYTATVSTGAENGLVTDLTETALLTSGAAWTTGRTLALTTIPPADGYLYIVNGEGAVPGTYTAGIFLIELYGT
jgi:hypothetical protein